jgi:adenosyl cobinamide kinase/adenosyl cobinamide phosphate guanylyltransferase
MKRQLDIDEPFDKRIQRHRIHSDAHIKTVDLLMSLARQLARQPPQPVVEEAVVETTTYTQKPYWPTGSQ